MATSSIIENIRINNPHFLEEYAAHLEAKANGTFKPEYDYHLDEMTDPERIRKFAAGVLAKMGKKL